MGVVSRLKRKVTNQDQIEDLKQKLSVEKAKTAQLHFLLYQAPTMDIPDRSRACKSVTRFAYINPRTFALLSSRPGLLAAERTIQSLEPSPTKWLLTDLMPEGRVIFSPDCIPDWRPLCASSVR